MTDTVIHVEKLSKIYRVGQYVGYRTLQESLMNAVSAPFRRRRRTADDGPEIDAKQDDYIWALKNVSFDVRRGEVVGIIGRNGAGKTTLLKILSRTTNPTEGYAEIRGRVGSLLEVGTGFHPELTGRENVYFNGAVLGMKKKEIDRKFAEIVEFSEVEKFIDTPLKRYSSGMQVRLAFSVAAHLEPEILLVDEVLAVGDASFQRKCLGKMKDVSGYGRTIVFVSHSMPSIENLCERVLWIDKGAIVQDGEARQVVARYIDTVTKTVETRKIGEYQNLGHRRGTGEIQFTKFRFLNSNGVETQEITMGEPMRLEVDFQVFKDIEHAVFCFGLRDHLTRVFLTTWFGYQKPQNLREGERGTFSVVFPNNQLRARKYYFYLAIIGNNDVSYDIWDGVGTEFTVNYPLDVGPLEFPVGDDVALVSMPILADIRKG